MDATLLTKSKTLKKAREKALSLKKEISPARPEIYSVPTNFKITDTHPLELNGKHIDELLKFNKVKKIKM